MRGDSGTRGIYKRRRHDGEYWAYRFQHDGKSYSETTGLKATQKLLPAARRALDEHLQRVRHGQQPVATAPIRFTEAANKFLEWSRMEHREHPATALRQQVSLAKMARFFEDRQLADLRPGDVENYKLHRRQKGIAEVTLRKDLLALSQVVQFGIKQGWATANPVKQVELPSDRDSINETTISLEEEALYFAEALCQNQVLHDVGRLMLWQGLRPQEVLGLTQADVDLDGRVLSVSRGKSRAAKRELYLHENVAALLRPRVAGPHRHLFPGGRWGYSGQPYSYSGLVNAHLAVFAELNRERLTLEPFDIYSLRHTFATRFYQATKDLDKLARILGHANLATVRRYVNPSREDLREAMKLFETSCNFGATPEAKLRDNGDSGSHNRP